VRLGTGIAVVIPAFNEQLSIGRVVSAVPQWVDDIVVVDNGSTDRTAEHARACGARVVSEPRRGYGSACLAGIAALRDPGVVVFLDGDFSDYPDEMNLLVDPILRGEADMAIGSRVLGRREVGALPLQARMGNWLACRLMRMLWKVQYTDLGPFRAIRHSVLQSLEMQDGDYGWTVEMQVKAAERHLRVLEKPTSYRRRIGKSKISGTLKGAFAAAVKILCTIFAAAIGRYHGSSSVGREALIVFTRYPEPGKTKTRLVPVLGAEGAAELHRRMTARTLDWANELARSRRVRVAVSFAGGTRRLMRQWLGNEFSYLPQCAGSLGRRMERAFAGAFAAGARRVVIVGTDCPGMTAYVAGRAFEQLNSADVVLGPATDGGYYLVGLRNHVPELFEDIRWGTQDVLEQTMQAAGDLGLACSILEPMDDIDRPSDLAIWEKSAGGQPSPDGLATISVIIPSFNEVENIRATLETVTDTAGVEVIVVDGGSRDGTAQAVDPRRARVLHSRPCRAGQMNIGAAAAKGDILVFLHADTRLAAGFEKEVRRILRQPSIVAGAFRFRLDADGFGLRVVERLVGIRSKWLQMPYGDQALFLKAEVFRGLGEFADMPIMEDFDLVRRLRRIGRVVTSDLPAVTSARRWVQLGTIRTTLVNQVTIMAHLASVSPARIARWYYGAGTGGGSPAIRTGARDSP